MTVLQVNSCLFHRLSGQDFVKKINLDSYSSLLLKQKFKKFGIFSFSLIKRYGYIIVSRGDCNRNLNISGNQYLP